MTKPPKRPAPSEWYCDRCGDTITDTGMSLVIWRMEDEAGGFADKDYRVIHKGKCDPGSSGPSAYTYSADVSEFLGEEGMAYLLSMLAVGPLLEMRGHTKIQPKDMRQFVDLFRRMQVPYYEEARRHFGCPGVIEDYSDANELYPYRARVLERIIEHDGDCYHR